MKSIIAVIRAPGTGKSTLMNNYIENWEWHYDTVGQLDHYKSGDMIVLGGDTEGESYGVTDKLSS